MLVILVVVIIDEFGYEIFVISGVLEWFCKVCIFYLYIFDLFKEIGMYVWVSFVYFNVGDCIWFFMF